MNSAATPLEGRFQHGQIIQTWVVYSSIGKSFSVNVLIKVNQTGVLFKIFGPNDYFIYICT